MKTKKEIEPVLSWFSSDIDENDIEFEWDYLLENIDELLRDINPDGYWFCSVEGFGWRNLSGETYLEFTTGREMISKVLPNTDCSFNIFREEKKLKIQNHHHDSPTGNEWYELMPVSYEEYQNNK